MPVQRPLRAAKNFDTVEIEELGQHGGRARDVDAVDVHGRARIRAGECRSAANSADGELREPCVLRDGEARCQASQIGDRVYLALRQLGLRQDADRHWDFLKLPFTGPIGRDGHLLEDLNR